MRLGYIKEKFSKKSRMSYFVCLDLNHVKKDMPTKSGVFFLNGLTFHKHKMDALISQSTHYTQFIYAPNLIGEESPSES